MHKDAKAFVAYLQAIIAASILFTIITYTSELLLQASSFSLQERVIRMMPSAAISLIVMIIITFFLAAIPFWLAKKFADYQSLHRASYYILSGGLAGLLIAGVALIVIPVPATVTELPPVEQLLVHMALRSIPSGALGGYVYWRAIQRNSRDAASN